MKLTRRRAIQIGAATTAGIGLGGCSSLLSQANSSPGRVVPERAESRILNRVAFGPSATDLQRVTDDGTAAYIAMQLKPLQSSGLLDFGGYDLNLKLKLRHLDVLEVDAAELRDLPEQEVLRQLQQAAILTATYSPYQLRERMVDFWTNHFNIYARKGLTSFRLPVDQANVIRRHALGTFPDLLKASARSTAMLVYLDNQLNVSGGPNENYARELMELHSMGVNGGYTQKDVQEVARCFTGWSMETRFLRPRGRFWFDESRHDSGEKKVLGQTIPAGGGVKDGERVLEIIANHPSTANFISTKLCRYFLGEPSDGVISDVASVYASTKGDLSAMLGVILTPQRLMENPAIVKRPFDYLVSALRLSGADTDGAKPLQEWLDAMGQPLYQWPMPDGYPDHTAAWTGSLLARWNFGLALCSGSIQGTQLGDIKTNDLLDRICAPAFMWR